MLPATDCTTEQQGAGLSSEEGAVALISLSGALQSTKKADTDEFVSMEQPQQQLAEQQQEPEQQEELAAPPSLPDPHASTAAGPPEASITAPSTPTGWRHRMFNTAKTPEQQQAAPALPPGCLVLDGEALMWNSHEDEQQQQQMLQQQQQQRQKLGYNSESGGSSPREGATQPLRMRGSMSSPNLVLLADGSHSRGLQDQPLSQQQQQQDTQLQPMHSSHSADNLLAFYHPAPSFSSNLYSSGLYTSTAAAPQSTSASGATPKSRLGRPTGGETSRSQVKAEQHTEQQQQQQLPLSQQQQQPEAPPLDSQQQWAKLQQEAQQQQQQQPFVFSPLDTLGSSSGQQQQQGFGPLPRPVQDDFTVGASSGSARVTSWTFSRCNSGLSLGSEALARKLRIHCVTFNMNGKLPASLPPEMLGECGALEGVDADGSPDLMVFATQENTYISEWEKLLSSVLNPGGYERLAWHSLRAIHLVLFAGKRFRRQVMGIHGSSVATGIGNVVGNKGAVALSVELLDIKLLFISSHLAAHGDQVQQRNADYQRIKAGLFATPAATTPRSGTSSGRSPRPRRGGSMEIPRNIPLSAPSCVGHSDSGAKSPRVNDMASSSGAFDLLGSCDGSGPWAGFLRSNRVMDSSPFEDFGESPASAAARKRVSWWAELSQGDSSHTCSSPILAINSSGTSEGNLARTLGGVSPSAASVTAQLNKLRVASCPAMEQQQGGPLGPSSVLQCGSIGSSSGVASGESTPWGSGTLSAGDRTGSMTSSFLRTLVGKQPGKNSGRSVDALDAHDVVFWLGDLNYRINGNSKAVRHLMRSRLHEVLHANDQLRLQQKMGTVFQGFQEGNIRFPPTFKFLPGSSAYSEKRVPSWTDRILWKVRSGPQQQQQQQQQQQSEQQPQLSWVNGEGSMTEGSTAPAPVPPCVNQLYYTSVPEITSSDHKPVIAGFQLGVVGEEEEEQRSTHSSDESDDEGVNAKRSRCCFM